MALDRRHVSDLRGVTRLAVDATAGITQIVETMHRTIQSVPGPLGRAPANRTRGITGLVYRSIHGVTRLVGKSIDVSLAPIATLLPEESGSTPARDAFLSVLNGVYGDYLVRTENPLAIEMSLCHRGRRVGPSEQEPFLDEARVSASTGRLLLLVHGLCMNDRQWSRKGHDHGAALADDLGYVPLYLRYNSGLRVGTNGRCLAEELEQLDQSGTLPFQELVIIGHSMGGLVARSACEHARVAGHDWLGRLRKMVFLGTPHLGVPLERGGQLLDYLIELSPYSAPFARIGRLRSAGITDLSHGGITTNPKEPMLLPAHVECYAAAATLSSRRSALSERLVGDGLVPLDSALGRHSDATRALAIPESRQWIGHQMGHLELLNRSEVYTRLRNWLSGTA